MSTTTEVPTPTPAPAPSGHKRQSKLFRQRQRSIAAAANSAAELLQESNVAAIGRLMEIFGEAYVTGVAESAKQQYDEAKAQGPEAYHAQPNGTAVATYTGAPRSCGGVFFYLIRNHATQLGLDWFGLRIPSLPRDLPNPNAPQGQGQNPAQPQQPAQPAQAAAPAAPPKPQPATPPAPAQPPKAAPAPAAAAQPAKAAGDQPAAPKPNRFKATVVGTPVGEPAASDQPGVLRLVFEVEMTPTMPKGLPTLGKSRVIVLCTEKQYRGVRPANGGAPGRMIVEGEAAATLSTAGKPLVVLVCTRLTTPEIEQNKHAAQP